MNEVPSALHAFSHLVLTTLCLGGKYYHNPHFINKKIKAERGQTMCPKSERGWKLVAMNLNKASLVLELTHLRRKISKRTTPWTQHWNIFILASRQSTRTKEQKLLEKLAHYMKKCIIILLGI